MVIGVIGGVASGKSVVTAALRDLGARILDADRIGHDVLRLPHVKEQIRERWGDAVIDSDGEVNRRALGAIVFDPQAAAELAALEKITHPEIEQRIREQLELATVIGGSVVLDAPVMVKTGWYRLCNVLLFVDCPRPKRLEHARLRGWSAEMLDAREASQSPLERKRALATHVISNDGTLEELREQTRQFWLNLGAPAAEAGEA